MTMDDDKKIVSAMDLDILRRSMQEAGLAFGKAAKAVDDLLASAVDVPDVKPLPPIITPPDPETELYVDRDNGDDLAPGTADAPIKTFKRMAEMLKPRMRVIVMPGFYREQMMLDGLDERLDGELVWIKAETPQAVTLTDTHWQAASARARWQRVKGDVWRTDASVKPWAGFARDRFLFLFQSLSDLQSAKIAGVNAAPYGLAYDKRNLFCRMPDGVDPNGEHVMVTSRSARNLIHLNRSPNVILDGFRLVGSGNGPAIATDQSSTNLTVRNCKAELCRMMARLANDSVMQWNTYTYPGFMRWAEDVAALNDNRIDAAFKMIKGYRQDAIYEGRIAIAPNIAKNCRFERNLMTEVFDAQTLGEFKQSVSVGNISVDVLDDSQEFEGWSSTMESERLDSMGDWSINAFGSDISIQPKHADMKGPIKLIGGVSIKRSPLATPAYLIKIMGDFRHEPEITIDRWFFHNQRGPNGWGKSWLYLDNARARGAKLTIINSVIYMPDGIDVTGAFKPDCDYNVVVADKPYPEIQGPNGRFFADIADLKLVDYPNGLDVRPTAESPLIGAGMDGETIGPYEHDDTVLLPRPINDQWTDALPAAWRE